MKYLSTEMPLKHPTLYHLECAENILKTFLHCFSTQKVTVDNFFLSYNDYDITYTEGRPPSVLIQGVLEYHRACSLTNTIASILNIIKPL